MPSITEEQAEELKRYYNEKSLESIRKSLICQKCGSDDCKSFEVVHKMLSSSEKISAYSFGNGITFTEGKISGGKDSLAHLVSPPKEKFGGCAIFVILLFVVGAVIRNLTDSFIIVLVFVGLMLITGGFGIRDWGKKTYEKSLDEWKRKWICLRCGNIWLNNIAL